VDIDALIKLLEQVGPQLVTVYSSLNPIVGATLGAFLLAGIAYLVWRSNGQKEEKREEKANSDIGKDTASDQRTAGNVQDRVDDFLDGP